MRSLVLFVGVVGSVYFSFFFYYLGTGFGRIALQANKREPTYLPTTSADVRDVGKDDAEEEREEESTHRHALKMERQPRGRRRSHHLVVG